MNTRITVYPRLFLLVFLVLLIFIPSLAQAAEENELQVQLQTAPEVDAIRPDLDVAQFSILVKDKKGQPVKDVELAFTLESPAKKFFPSTDFPIVEGTTLMNGKVLAPEGKLNFKYVFPIRGEYTLKVKAAPAGKPNQTVEKILRFSLNENPPEVRNAIIFISGLLLLGFAAGYILTSHRVAKEVAKV